MTEYGRGPGSEPWHPDDPLYGDGGWTGGQAQAGQQFPYGDRSQHAPQQYRPEQQYDEWGRPYDPQQYDQQYAQQPQYAPPPAPAADPATDRLTALKELGELKEQGILTEAEFESEKAKILAS